MAGRPVNISDIRYAWARTVADIPADPNKSFAGVVYWGREGLAPPLRARKLLYHRPVEMRSDDDMLKRLKDYLTGQTKRPGGKSFFEKRGHESPIQLPAPPLAV